MDHRRHGRPGLIGTARRTTCTSAGRRRHHLGRLLRRQDVAALGHHQPRSGGSRLRAVHSHPAHGLDHGPSFGLALILFTGVGLATPAPEGSGDLDAVLAALDHSFAIGPHLLLPLVLVLALVVRRMPAFPARVDRRAHRGLFAVAFQPEAVLRYVGEPELARPVALVKGVWQALHGGYVLESGNPVLDELLSRGGMASMLQTVWLIMTAMMYGAVLEATGILQALARRILYAVRTAGGLIVATLATAFGVNVLASDQYISIVLPGRMFRSEYERRAARPEEPVADPRGLRDDHVGADSVEHVRRVSWPRPSAFRR